MHCTPHTPYGTTHHTLYTSHQALPTLNNTLHTKGYRFQTVHHTPQTTKYVTLLLHFLSLAFLFFCLEAGLLESQYVFLYWSLEAFPNVTFQLTGSLGPLGMWEAPLRAGWTVGRGTRGAWNCTNASKETLATQMVLLWCRIGCLIFLKMKIEIWIAQPV